MYPAPCSTWNFEITKPELDQLYGTDTAHLGWCMTDPDKYVRGEHKPITLCTTFDGVVGLFGETPGEAFCINQCTGPAHGECHNGACRVSGVNQCTAPAHGQCHNGAGWLSGVS